jgi:hypothetical protein
MYSPKLQTAKDPAEGCIVLTDTLLRCRCCSTPPFLSMITIILLQSDQKADILQFLQIAPRLMVLPHAAGLGNSPTGKSV